MKVVKIDNITFINGCSLEYIKTLEENSFHLAIIDPPYGINEDGKKNHSRGILAKSKKYTPKNWDKKPPGKNFFLKLKFCSKNQIIWGANHFISKIPFDSPSWIVWDKDNGNNDFADCELAYTSFNNAVRKFRFRWQGMLQENMKNKEIRTHPTQKPVKLYEWILINYAKEGDSILDTYGGSGSIAIACHNLGYNLTIIEKDKEYFNNMIKRFNAHRSQLRLF